MILVLNLRNILVNEIPNAIHNTLLVQNKFLTLRVIKAMGDSSGVVWEVPPPFPCKYKANFSFSTLVKAMDGASGLEDSKKFELSYISNLLYLSPMLFLRWV